tara:strand:- start:2375 stop:3727 length:1353 start_codon:yes stop_codon:yes gene_type:complete
MVSTILGTAFGLLLIFLASGMYIAAALGLLGLSLDLLFDDRPLWKYTADMMWWPSTNFVLFAVPLYVLMGELLLRSGLTDRLYQALAKWLSFLPGGLMHSNIAACSVFAAVSGSSVATAITIGTVALPSFERQGYNERLVLGSLAAGGTLGILIPPSIGLIIYALITDTSVGRLFIGGVVPGLSLAGMFMLFIGVSSILNPGIAPKEASSTWGERLNALPHLVPTGSLILLVMGSIYFGFATPTEAAALGVVGSLILAILTRRVSRNMLLDGARATANTTGLVMLIVVFAQLFQFMVGSLGVPRAISEWLIQLGVPPMVSLLFIIIFYIILGMFMDALSMVITTLPVIFPVVVELFAQNPEVLAFDPVTFGVIVVLLMEAGLITPPVGVNLYVIQGIRTTKGPMIDVAIGVVPFFIMMMILVGVLIAFPNMVLWLPDLAFGASVEGVRYG